MSSDRGVSTVVGYVITLGITTVLISGLLIAAGGAVDDRQDATSRDALDVIGQRIASNLMAADRLAETDPGTTVVDVRLPSRIAGSGYRVTVNGSASELVLESNRADATVHVPFVTGTDVTDTEVVGGDLRIVLTAADELEVRRA